jgi:hypothetical protein
MSWRDDIPCLYGPPVDRSPYKPEPFIPPVTTTAIIMDERNHIDTVFFEMIMKLSEKIAFTEEIMNIINEARTKLSK